MDEQDDLQMLDPEYLKAKIKDKLDFYAFLERECT
jgi:hypothetical protein